VKKRKKKKHTYPFSLSRVKKLTMFFIKTKKMKKNPPSLPPAPILLHPIKILKKQITNSKKKLK